ncbi:helix-turn-helix transcriptional regulator [Secundilactobacillus malefermentans]|uniref:helix-turn-helix transcriptional regulator n=1 Tax=Secundilactobacillus malefermentans TaxID=176292 RepID=UPI0011C78407|nr:helix-turn-helix transcriptional regulator [Secundilactobacillus malefermentans]QEA31490.1 helix-turn-helix transcriptional regulator [Secundilactobacillus malefermentans]
MEFTDRQTKIINMLKKTSPLTGDTIAKTLGLSVPTIRGDLRLLTTVGVLKSRPKVGYRYQGDQLVNVDYDDLYDIPVGDIMLAPTKINDEASLQEAVSKLFLKDVGSLYVVDQQQQIVGLISRKDLLRASFNSTNPESMLASVIMTRMPNLISATPQTTVMEAGKLLLKHQVDSLPVVEKKGSLKVIGKITKNRIFQHFIERGQI